MRKGRLVHTTLAEYDKKIDGDLLKWFRDNIVNIFEFCFVKGLAKNSSDWADIIWYINLVDEDSFTDMMITMKSISSYLKNGGVEYGKRGGGTTIQLPFGFVQWHDPAKKGNKCLQFHHDLEKLLDLIKNGAVK